MTNRRRHLFTGIALAAAGVVALSFAPAPVQAGRWDFSISIPVHRRPPPCWYRGWTPRHVHYDYYPVYNPVVERDVYEDGHVHYDGTVHSDTLVEDRHATYYSPGRNEAITQPRTTVQRRGGLGFNQEQERTSWIGADGQPHSTTITRTNTQDRWGNNHTDTHVSLKNRQGSNRNETKPQPADKAPKEPKKAKVKAKK